MEDSASHQSGTSGDETISRATQTERTFINDCIIVVTAASSMLINTANLTSVSISLPTIQKELDVEPAQLQWLISAYSLSSGCLFLVCGRLADLYGRKRTFVAGSLFLAAATLACGFSQNIITLDVLRAVQGMGAAATIPSSLGILAHAFPPSRARSLAFATFAAGAPVGAIFGTIVGGVLTEFTAKTWRTSFYLFSGMGLLCFIGGLVSIDADRPSEEIDKRIDWIGAFLVTAGLIFIIFVLSQGEIAPNKWATPYIIGLLVAGVCLIGIFLYWQYYLEKVQDNPDRSPYSVWTPPPLIKFSIWGRANGRFGAMMAIAFTNWAAFLSWAYWAQLYYQDFVMYKPVPTAVRLLPMFVSGVACNLFVGFTASRLPVIYLLVGGSLGTSIACLLFAIIRPEVTYWAYGFISTIISVMGADFIVSAGTLFIARAALPHEQSVAGALFNTMGQLGTAVGVTVSTVVFDSVDGGTGSGGNTLQMYHAAQWAGFAFGVIGIVLGMLFFRGVGVVGFQPTKTAEHNIEVAKPELPVDQDGME